MKIETDRYLITHDGDQYVLQQKTVVVDSKLLKDKSKVGTYQVSSEKRYFPKIEHLFNRVLALELASDDDVKTIECIINKIDSVYYLLSKGELSVKAKLAGVINQPDIDLLLSSD